MSGPMEQESSLDGALVRRAPLLRALSSSPKEKPALREALSVSRSTVDRGLRELEAAGFVERDDDRYRLTLAGRIALDAVERFTDRAASIEETTDLLGDLSHDTPLSPAVVAGAEVVRPDQTAPDRPFERVAAFVERADDVRGVLTAVSGRYVELYAGHVADGMSVSVVVTPEVVERLASRYGDQARAMLSTGNASLRELDERYPFGLTLGRADGRTRIALTVYGDYGVAGVIVNDAPDAVAWAEGFFEDAWDRATPIPNP